MAERSITVVVPTRDRPAALARSLASLAQQSPAVEIVVVDDGSVDEAAVREAAAAAELVRLSGNGPAAARNAGVAVASGEVVAFLDDDCEAIPEWSALLAAGCEGTGAAAGLTVLPASAGSFAGASQHIADFLRDEAFDLATGTTAFAPSCNLALARSLALELPFDERFPGAAGEDREWCDRAAAAGVAIRLIEDAIVVHHQRTGPRAFTRQQLAYGRGAVQYRRLGAAPRPAAGSGFHARLIATGMARGARAGALVAAAQGLTLAGALAELPRSGEGRGAAAQAPEPVLEEPGGNGRGGGKLVDDMKAGAGDR
jgi:GT2 family glycosyltransferase